MFFGTRKKCMRVYLHLEWDLKGFLRLRIIAANKSHSIAHLIVFSV